MAKDEVTIEFDHALPSITIYDPTLGTAPVRNVKEAASLKLTLSDHPLILSIGKK